MRRQCSCQAFVHYPNCPNIRPVTALACARYRITFMNVPFIGCALPSSARRAQPMKRNNEMNEIDIKIQPNLPHHGLIAYQALKELALAVINAQITDPHLYDQATRAAKNALLNVCEGAGQWDAGKKRSAYAIARGEACEAAGCVETAALFGAARPGSDVEVNRIAAWAA